MRIQAEVLKGEMEKLDATSRIAVAALKQKGIVPNLHSPEHVILGLIHRSDFIAD